MTKIKWAWLSGRRIAYQPPQEELAVAKFVKAKSTTKEPISI
jgi:hypothetical protein